MNNSLLIFFGAGIGGVLRYWIAHAVHLVLSRQFPYGTMIVNITGCLLIGFIFIVTTERLNGDASSLRALLLIGLLGGYTTFSSFSLESILLFENGRWISGLLYIVCTTTLCLLATVLGVIGGRSL